jgi:hypothetical protein
MRMREREREREGGCRQPSVSWTVAAARYLQPSSITCCGEANAENAQAKVSLLH